MLMAKAESHLSHMKRDLNFFKIKFNRLLFTFFTVSYIFHINFTRSTSLSNGNY